MFIWSLVSPDRAECFSADTLTRSSFTFLHSSNLEQNSRSLEPSDQSSSVGSVVVKSPKRVNQQEGL